jgi:hypothetical protein
VRAAGKIPRGPHCHQLPHCAEIPQTILFKRSGGRGKVKWWVRYVRRDYYIEIQRHGPMNFDNTGVKARKM